MMMVDIESQGWLSREELVLHRMESFHRQRVEAIIAEAQTDKQHEEGLFILHLIPQASVEQRIQLQASDFAIQGASLVPHGGNLSKRRFNVDGLLLAGLDSRTQLFRDGRLEGVMSEIVYQRDELKVLRVGMCEKSLFATIRGYLKFVTAVGLKPPLWLFGTIAGCEEARIVLNRSWHEFTEECIDRPIAFLPPLELASFDVHVEVALRPFCDALWQSAGAQRSLNYSENGCWQEPR